MNPRRSHRPLTRAELSPVAAARYASPARTSAGAGKALASEPFDTVVRLEPAPPLEARRWPSWHRGPLDRLQPELTRYRD